MMLAFALRLVGPQLVPSAYLRWLDLAAAGWLAGFGLLAWRIFPLVFRPRIDGREH
jgi:uncharacterized protein involved in response to NO